jgi:N utilization substance protein A
MDLKSIIQVAEQIARDKGIEIGKVYEAIESALAAAYKKEQGDKSAIIRAQLDPDSGDVQFSRVKEVVDENTVRIITGEDEGTEKFASTEATDSQEERLPRYNPERHILISEALKIKKDAKVGDELTFPLPPSSDFGRIATQAAKQRIIQMLREAEIESVTAEFKGKEGHVVSGVIQRFDRGNVYVDLGRVIAVMLKNETIPGEHYTVGERMRFYVLSVGGDIGKRKVNSIFLSRSHPKFVAELFRMEVPEIADGAVEIKSIAREAGSRTKIAVASNTPGVDAVGSCVGQRGTRVMTVTNELGVEKIDIVGWSENPDEFISSALAPAKTRSVELLNKHEARVLVQDDQLSLAIGKGGQNVRLAAKLTGWKIDVRPASNPDKVQEGGVAVANVDGEFTQDGEVAPPASGATLEERPKPIYHKPEEDDE